MAIITALTDMAMGMNRGSSGSAGWDYVIRPSRKWFDLDLRALFRFRDLVFMYVRRNLATAYKQTILGPLWYFIQPVMTILVYMFIFGGLAGISTSGIPKPLFYMAGILFWNYFTECFNASSNVFVANAHVFGKVYFPRLVVPLSGLMSGLLKLGIQLVLFVGIYIWSRLSNDNFSLNFVILLFPVLIAMLAFYGLAWGLVVSSLTYKYRDMRILIGFVVQLLMYATPVVYPLETVPDKYKLFISLNPLSPIFETFKYGCFGIGAMNWIGLAYSLGVLMLAMLGAVLVFNRVEHHFMDCV